MTPFSIECFQNEFLPQGGDEMNAVLTVTASGTGSGPATTEERSELILVDRSGSMSGKKLRSAKAATAAAIDCIPDGVRFGVISGNHKAEMTYPLDGPLAVASPETREAAKAAVKTLESAGGTAMGTWIRLAAKTLGDETGIRHAILLTDGKNENEEPSDLEAALQVAEGKFQCDCRGVGDNWVVAELRKVASSLVGTYDIVADPADLENDFSTMMRDALSKQVADVVLRVWTPQGGEVLALRQMEPPLDLIAARVEAGPRMGDYGTGSWGDESRDFFLSVRVLPADVDEEKLAARVTLLVGDEPGEQGMIRAVWTDDAARSTQINRRVAAAMDEEELAEEIQGVVDSFRIGDVDSATNHAGRAVRMAHQAGNRDVIDRLSKLVDIEDAATGRVRLKAKVDALDVMIFETKSTRTSRTPQSTPLHPFAGSDPALRDLRVGDRSRRPYRRVGFVSATCPEGHRSETPDYCSICGMAIPPTAPAIAPADRCPNCGSSLGADMRCTACAYLVGASDSVAPWLAENWEVLIRADRAYYEMLEPDGMDFPDRNSTRRIPLTGDHVRIGRRSKTKGVQPEIDLSDALEDTAVSHKHAVLMRQPQGTWALVDQESTNGTYLNDDEDPIPPNQSLTLSDGDQIHVGAWTTITIERLAAPEAPHLELESRPSKDTRNIAHGRRAVEIDVLGPLRLRVRGEEVPLTASKERAVLTLLALRIGSAMSAVDIEFGLWGETEPKTANKTLQMYISNLRKKLPDNVIETSAQGYRLNGLRDSVDVFRFERRCGRGRALLTSGHPGAAVVWLDRALELWRGDPFLDLSDGPTGTTEVVSVSERKATAEEDRFEGRLQLGQHQDIVADLGWAVDAEPLRQRRWGQLMLALYRSGRKVDALRCFQRLRDVLDKYGLEPSTELSALDNAIALDRPDLQWTAPTPAGESVSSTVA